MTSMETTVILTPEDAALFLQFQKRFAFMKTLEEIGAFNLRSGSITIHFDNLGLIVGIDKKEHFRV